MNTKKSYTEITIHADLTRINVYNFANFYDCQFIMFFFVKNRSLSNMNKYPSFKYVLLGSRFANFAVP